MGPGAAEATVGPGDKGTSPCCFGLPLPFLNCPNMRHVLTHSQTSAGRQTGRPFILAWWGAGLVALGGCWLATGRSTDDELASTQQPLWVTAWKKVESASTFDASDPPSLVSQVSSELEVWARNGSVLHRNKRISGVWGSWVSETPSLTAGVSLGSGVATVHRGSQVVSMAARGSNQALFHRWRDAAGTWSSWDSLGGGIKQAPAISSTGSKVQIWARGLDDALWLKRWNSSAWDAWRGPSSSPALAMPSGVTIVGAPAATNLTSTTAGVAFLGSSGSVYFATWDDSSAALSSWAALAPPSGVSLSLGVGLSNNGSLVTLWAVSSGANGKVFRRVRASGTWSAWTDDPSLASGTYLLAMPTAGVGGPPAGLWRGEGVDTGTDVLFVGSSEQRLFERTWYSMQASGTVKLSPDRVVRVSYNSENWGCDPTPRSVWETVAVIGPPSMNGCGGASGKLIMNSGWDFYKYTASEQSAVWRVGLDCLQGTAGGSGACGSNPTCQGDSVGLWANANTTGMPNPADVVDANAFSPAGRYKTGDPQIVRTKGVAGNPNQPSLLMQKQATIKKNGTYSNNIQRGAEMIFQSTDCGTGWAFKQLLDPCDPNLLSAKFCKTTVQGGFDRPEMIVSRQNPSTAYIVMKGDGENFFNNLLLRSADSGATWSPVPLAGGGYVDNLTPSLVFKPASIKNRLYLFNEIGAELRFRWFDEDTSLVEMDPDATNSDGKIPLKTISRATTSAENWRWNPIWISPVGSYSDGDYLRLIYPSKIDSGGYQVQRYVVLNVRVEADKTVSVVSESSIGASSSTAYDGNLGSVFSMKVLDLDRFDLASSHPSNTVLLYWLESEDSIPVNSTTANVGQVGVKGCLIRNLEDCTPFNLSVDGGGNYRRWAGWADDGDSYNGAAYF